MTVVSTYLILHEVDNNPMKNYRGLLFVAALALLVSDLSAQNDPRVDSLLGVVDTTGMDSLRIDALMALGNHYKYDQPDTSLYYFQQGLEVAEKAGLQRLKANCLRHVAIALETRGDYDVALEGYLEALAAYQEVGDRNGSGSCYNDIAVIHLMQGSNDLAIEYLTKSLEIKEELGDMEGIANCCTNLAVVRVNQGMLESAIEFVLRSAEIYEKLDDKEGIGTSLGNVGSIYNYLGRYRESINYHLKSIESYREIGYREGMAHAYTNITSNYATMADSSATNPEERARCLKEAIRYGKMALEIAEEVRAMYLQSTVSQILREVYIMLGDYRKAMEYAEIFMIVKDSLFNQEKTQAIQEMETRYETDRHRQQIELQQAQLDRKDLELRQQRMVRNTLIAGLLLFVAIIGLTVYAYIQKRMDNRTINRQKDEILFANRELTKYNEEVMAQRDAIQNQRDEIEAQKNEITDSIAYAQRIQAAVLPKKEFLERAIPEHFVLYMPRDIVSGDFYWIREVRNFLIIVVADCTGHGVPGAFMSMLGITLLNERISKSRLDKPGEILNRLRDKVKDTLAQEGRMEEQKDGMDLSLAMINTETRELDFAGAFNSLFLIRGSGVAKPAGIGERDTMIAGNYTLYVLRGDRQPIGIYSRELEFNTRRVQLQKEDTLYMFSDGYADQIGGPDRKKFMGRRFKKELLDIQGLSMKDQQRHLEETIGQWRGDEEQVDDILVMGIRV